jgi:hypothetical protein
MLLLSWQHHQLLSLAPEGLRPPDIFELAELRVAILCKHVCEVGALLGESRFRTLMRLIDWQRHQLSPPQPLDQDFIDTVRWRVFRDGINKVGWDAAGDYAADQLKDSNFEAGHSPFAAGPDMMQKSYQNIQRQLRGLQPSRGAAFRFR